MATFMVKAQMWKEFLKKSLKKGNFHFAFRADEVHKGQKLVLVAWMLWEVQIQNQYKNTNKSIKKLREMHLS